MTEGPDAFDQKPKSIRPNAIITDKTEEYLRPYSDGET